MLKEALIAILRRSGMTMDELKGLSTAELLNSVKKIRNIFGLKKAVIEAKPLDEMLPKYKFKPEDVNSYIDRINNGEIPILVEEESLTPALRVAQSANRDKIWTNAAERNAEKIEENYNLYEPVAPLDIDAALTYDIRLNPEKYKGYPWMIDRAKDNWGTFTNGEFLPF